MAGSALPSEQFATSTEAPSKARRGDDARVRGAVRFAADVRAADTLHVAFARSPFPRGRLNPPDCEAARKMPGVVAVFTAQDFTPAADLTVNPVIPIEHPLPFPLLADGRVVFVGQPVALVVAHTVDQARDACDAIAIDVEDDEAALDTVVARAVFTRGDAQKAAQAAAVTVGVEIKHPRLAPAPMEPRAISVAVDGDRLTVHLASQTPHRARHELARVGGIDPSRLRVVAQNVGGAFGQKASLTPEDVLTVMAAAHLGRSLSWTALRGEDFLAAPHGRATTTRGRLSVAADGRFLALEAEATAAVGAWLTTSCAVPAWNSVRILPGPYAIEDAHLTTRAVASHAAPVGIYRGAGRPEAAMLMERLVDEAAATLGIDPMEIRLRNVVPTERMPHELPSGAKLDSGDYTAMLSMLRRVADYDDLSRTLAARRYAGEVVGAGIALYVEPSGSGWESARVRVFADGTATVETGATVQGHTREDVFAQIAGDALGLPAARVTVVHGDTAAVPEGIGALASRSTAIGGSAVHVAATRLAARAKTAPIPPEGLVEEERYTAPGEAFGAGAHLAVVRICADTGVLGIERYVGVDDAGRILAPAAVRGQLEGGIAQGVGEALMERIVYDTEGNLQTGSFMDYAMPRADDLAFLADATIEHMTSPSPVNALGVKGVGEAGTIGAPAAISNAVHDALRATVGPGIRLDPPFTPQKLWQAMNDAKGRTTQ